MKRHKGITLIEMMVVIAIIGILSAIAFTAFSQSKAAGKNAATISNISQLGKAISLYTGDFDSSMPYACTADDKFTTCHGETAVDMPLITDVLSSYVTSKETWHDSLDTGIPRLSPKDYNEPIECQLGGTTPSMFERFGNSFLYRHDLGSDHVVEPFEMISEGSAKTISQAEIVIMHTAYGNWRGGPDVSTRKVVALFGDSHVRTIPLTEAHQQGAFHNLK